MVTAQFPIPLPSAQTRALFLDALREKGTMLAACRAAGATRADVRGWLRGDPAFEQDLEDAVADFKDSLQEEILLCIKEGRDTVALRFLLRAEMPDKYGPRPLSGLKPWYEADEIPGPPTSQEAVTEFFHYLDAAVKFGDAHVAPLPSRDASACPEPAEEDRALGSPEPGVDVPSRCIGWFEGDDLLLDPTASAQAACAYGEEIEMPLMIPPAAIGHCLQECGLLLSTEQDSEHLTVRRYIGGVRRRVLHVPAKCLKSPVPPVPWRSPNLLHTPLRSPVGPVPPVPLADGNTASSRKGAASVSAMRLE